MHAMQIHMHAIESKACRDLDEPTHASDSTHSTSGDRSLTDVPDLVDARDLQARPDGQRAGATTSPPSPSTGTHRKSRIQHLRVACTRATLPSGSEWQSAAAFAVSGLSVGPLDGDVRTYRRAKRGPDPEVRGHVLQAAILFHGALRFQLKSYRGCAVATRDTLVCKREAPGRGGGAGVRCRVCGASPVPHTSARA
eukprot:353522-Chlamydomonas_euryale.AAC.14